VGLSLTRQSAYVSPPIPRASEVDSGNERDASRPAKLRADLRPAVNDRWYDKAASAWCNEATFVDVTLWARQAEVACEYLVKGRSVLVEGRLHLDTWRDRSTGQKRSKLRVIGDTMQMLSNGSGHSPGRTQTPPPSANGVEAAKMPDEALLTAVM